MEGNGSIDQIGRVAVWEWGTACVRTSEPPDKSPSCSEIGSSLRPSIPTLSTGTRANRQRGKLDVGFAYNLSISKVSNLIVPVASSAEESAVVARIEEKLSRVDWALEQVDTQLARSKALRQSILKKAFVGQLVAQDPNDEPASALLDRIKKDKDRAGSASEINRKARKKTRATA